MRKYDILRLVLLSGFALPLNNSYVAFFTVMNIPEEEVKKIPDPINISFINDQSVDDIPDMVNDLPVNRLDKYLFPSKEYL